MKKDPPRMTDVPRFDKEPIPAGIGPLSVLFLNCICSMPELATNNASYVIRVLTESDQQLHLIGNTPNQTIVLKDNLCYRPIPQLRTPQPTRYPFPVAFIDVGAQPTLIPVPVVSAGTVVESNEGKSLENMFHRRFNHGIKANPN